MIALTNTAQSHSFLALRTSRYLLLLLSAHHSPCVSSQILFSYEPSENCNLNSVITSPVYIECKESALELWEGKPRRIQIIMFEYGTHFSPPYQIEMKIMFLLNYFLCVYIPSCSDAQEIVLWTNG